MPVERLENGAWPHPSRLPLGGGWRGYCTGPGHEGQFPEPKVLESYCNLGYAEGCGWVPRERTWDAVRFAVAAPPEAGTPLEAANSGAVVPSSLICLQYVCESNHRPVEHGDLEFDLIRATWLRRHRDARVQKMAECFLESYLKRRPEQVVFTKGAEA